MASISPVIGSFVAAVVAAVVVAGRVVAGLSVVDYAQPPEFFPECFGIRNGLEAHSTRKFIVCGTG